MACDDADDSGELVLSVEQFDSEVTMDLDPHTITFHSDNEIIATIGPDGTVTVHKAGADREAALVFWATVEVEGKTMMDRLHKAETLIETQAAAYASLLNVVNAFQDFVGSGLDQIRDIVMALRVDPLDPGDERDVPDFDAMRTTDKGEK